MSGFNYFRTLVRKFRLVSKQDLHWQRCLTETSCCRLLGARKRTAWSFREAGEFLLNTYLPCEQAPHTSVLPPALGQSFCRHTVPYQPASSLPPARQLHRQEKELTNLCPCSCPHALHLRSPHQPTLFPRYLLLVSHSHRPTVAEKQ